MRVLITNDDGIESPGITALAAVALELDLDVVVAAPAWNSSGASASITGVESDGQLLVDERTVPGASTRARTFALEASPAMIVRVGVRGAFGDPPDLVLSGINDGPNTGHAVLHSGTVGAALTAATHGCRAVAFSLGVAPAPDFRAARAVAASVIPWAMTAPAPLTLNVNVPSGDVEAVRGIRHAHLASFGAVDTQVTELDHGAVGVSYRELDPAGEPGSDATLLAEGFATITALRPVCEAEEARLHGLIDEVESTRS